MGPRFWKLYGWDWKEPSDWQQSRLSDWLPFRASAQQGTAPVFATACAFTSHPLLPGDVRVALAESLRLACARSALRSDDVPLGVRAPARGLPAPGSEGLGTPKEQKAETTASLFTASPQHPNVLYLLLSSKIPGLLSGKESEHPSRHHTCVAMPVCPALA